jgi:hypothetical protein
MRDNPGRPITRSVYPPRAQRKRSQRAGCAAPAALLVVCLLFAAIAVAGRIGASMFP